MLLITDANDLKTFGAGLRDWSCKESPFVNRDHGCILDEPEWPLLEKLGKFWNLKAKAGKSEIPGSFAKIQENGA